MAAREPTSVEALRQLAHVVDPGLHPTLNELPSLFAALVESHRVEGLTDKVKELREQGAGDTEIRQEVAHLIAPPDPDANATIVQGVPPEAHQAVLDELAALREAVAELRGQHQQQLPGGPVADPQQLTPEQQELQELREQVQRMAIAQAAGQHPTATSEPEPAPAEPAPPVAPPAEDTAG